MNKTNTSIIFILLFSFVMQAQENVAGVKTAEAHISYLGKSSPVRILLDKNKASNKSQEKVEEAKKKPDNFKNRRNFSKAVLPELEHQGPDKIRQTSAPTRSAIEPLVNINGIGDSGSPLDPSGDVGLENYVQIVNVTEIGIFSKNGSLIKKFNADLLWTEFGASSAGDPIVLYDETAARWLITEFTDPSNLLIAVSETSDPLGAFYAYTFSTPDFPDYPKYAIWPEAYMLTTNEEGPGVLHHYFIDRLAMLAGSDDVKFQRVEVPGNLNTEAGFFVATPVDWNGSLLPSDKCPLSVVLNDSSWGTVNEDQVELYRFHINWQNADSTSVERISIVTSPFDGYPCSDPGFLFSCIPQKGGDPIDAIPEVIMNLPHYRNFGDHESMVFSFITDATDGQNISGIRWVELRKTQAEDWHLYQEGTYAPEDGLHRFISSIAIDKKGNIGLAYNVTSDDIYVGIRFTGRFADDPLGVMTLQEYHVVEGKAPIQSISRFGDYGQMSVDAADQTTFWYTTEYAGQSSNVTQSRIVAFQLQRDSFDLSVSEIKNPITKADLGNNEAVSIDVTNSGIEPIHGFKIGYSINEVIIQEKLISDTLFSGQIKNYNFDVTADLSAKETYMLKAWTVALADQNVKNDTLKREVNNLDHLNVNLINSTANNVICADTFSVNNTIYNEGGDEIKDVEIEISVDGIVWTTKTFSTNILYQSKQSFTILVSGLMKGNHVITSKILEINGSIDIDTIDNAAEFNINVLDIGGKHTLTLKTDNFPEETTWILTIDGSSTPLYSGGPYEQKRHTFTESLCLESDQCYVFTIFDEYGDGICCSEGNGNYFISNNEGTKLVSSNGSFGENESSRFCTKSMCQMTLNITSTDDHGNADGSILLMAKNGLEPYTYSIDGGLNFSTSPLFENLPAALYHIIIYSNDGICFVSDSIRINLSSGVNNLQQSNAIRILPNPNDGYFHIEMDALAEDKNRISYQILDGNGRVLQERYMTKYDNKFLGVVSMMNLPPANYFIRANRVEGSTIVKFIKQ